MRGYFDAAGMQVDLGCTRQAKMSHESSGQHMNTARGVPTQTPCKMITC